MLIGQVRKSLEMVETGYGQYLLSMQNMDIVGNRLM